MRLPSRGSVVGELRRAKVALCGAANDLLDLSRAEWLDAGAPHVLHGMMLSVDKLWLALDDVMVKIGDIDERWARAVRAEAAEVLVAAEEAALAAQSLSGLAPGSAAGSAAAPEEAAARGAGRPRLVLVPRARPSVLIVEDQRCVGRGLQRLLRADCDVRLCASPREALAEIDRQLPDVVLCDYELGTDTSVAMLEELTHQHPGVRRVLYSASRPELWQHLIERRLIHQSLMKPGTREQLLAAVGSS